MISGPKTFKLGGKAAAAAGDLQFTPLLPPYGVESKWKDGRRAGLEEEQEEAREKGRRTSPDLSK